MKKKNNFPPHDWSHGWLAASFMSTASSLGLVPPPNPPNIDDQIEVEITTGIAQMLLSAGIIGEIEAAVLAPNPPSSRWRYIGVIKTDFGPVSCMIEATNPAKLADQSVFWANRFIHKYKKALLLMEKFDRLADFVHTPLRKKKGGHNA
jgi:hypothetical protein